jgi:hypothetical protein
MTPSGIERTYIVEAQLQVTALDPATAQEAITAAAEAANGVLQAASTPVTLSYEEQDGQPVLTEP